MGVSCPLSIEERRAAIQALANYALLEHASGASIESMVQAASFQRLPVGSMLLVEGTAADRICFVLGGVVRIFHTGPEGRQFTPKILRAPNHFGDLELLAGGDVNGQSVEVLDEVTVAIVPWPVMRELLLRDHLLCAAWLSGLASQFLYTIDADRHHVFVGLPGRIANVLLSYADVFGRPTRSGVELEHDLTREQLANQVGSVKRAVVRVVQDFVAKGWIASHGPRLVLKERAALLAQTLPRRLGLGHDMRARGLLR
jgi:CRP/FNR family transcriptional regulator, cyclic AMP receptor protein